jgi:hypothetical protein
MRMLIGLFAMAAVLIAQDDPKPAADPAVVELVQKLGDEDFRAREEAEKKLIQIGAPAADEVRKVANSEDVEVRERAKRILDSIERNTKVAKVYVVPAPITVQRKLTVKEALTLIQGENDKVFDLGALRTELDAEVTLDVKDGTPFDVLNAVCRQLEKVSYKIEGGQVKFVTEPFIDYPATSMEAFSVKIVRIEKYTSNNFQKKETAWAVTVSSDAFPTCKTFGNPNVSILEVVDADGLKAKASDKTFILGQDQEQNNQVNQWVQQVRFAGAFGGQQQEQNRRVYTFVAEKDVAKIASIKGAAAFYFRIDPRDVKFENVTQRQEMDMEDYKVILDRGYRQGNVVIMGRANRGGKAQTEGEALTLILEPKKESEKWLASVAGDLLEKDSVVAIDKNGGENKVEVTYHGANGGNMIMVNGQWQQNFAGSYSLSLGKLKVEEVKEIRLKIPGVHRKDVPFEIKDVKLP